MTLDDIKNSIQKANSIVILTHESPDGDAIGSSLAMYLALKSYEKNVDVIIPEYPHIYNFLPAINNIKTESNIQTYDLAISLDCSDLKRLNGFKKYFENAKVKISIDHHSINSMFADYNYVDHVSPACAQILFAIFNYFEIEITKEIGECLVTGLITDTGGFKHSNVTPETFEFVAGLLRKGINISQIYKKVLQEKTKSNFELTKLIMNRLEFLNNGKIAFTYMNLEEQKKLNVQLGDHEGLVEIGRDIEGVEVSVFLREDSPNVFKVSLRSNEFVDVSDICLLFGGGGHIKAAGCKIEGTLEHVKYKIISQIEHILKELNK